MTHVRGAGERKDERRRRRTFAALIFGTGVDDLDFTQLDGPYYPEVTSSLLVLSDTETGKRFHVKTNGLFVIEDDTSVGRYLAFLPKITVGVFNAGRFVLAAVKISPLYPEVVSGLFRLNTVDQGLRFAVAAGLMNIVDTGGSIAILPESGSKPDIENRFLLEGINGFGAGFGAGFE